jgi:hypothetical protein
VNDYDADGEMVKALVKSPPPCRLRLLGLLEQIDAHQLAAVEAFATALLALPSEPGAPPRPGARVTVRVSTGYGARMGWLIGYLADGRADVQLASGERYAFDLDQVDELRGRI